MIPRLGTWFYAWQNPCSYTNLEGISGKSPVHSTELMILSFKFSLKFNIFGDLLCFVLFCCKSDHIKSKLDVIKLCPKAKQKIAVEWGNFCVRFYCFDTVDQNKIRKLFYWLRKTANYLCWVLWSFYSTICSWISWNVLIYRHK